MIIMMCAVILLVSCSTQGRAPTEQLTDSPAAAKQSMPKEMPDDFDFKVSYGILSTNEVNTFEGTVTKDLVMNGTAIAQITLTIEEMKRIYEQVRQINIMKPKTFILEKTNCGRTPHEEDKWEIRVNGDIRTFNWSGEYCDTTSDGKQFIDLRKMIIDIVESKEEYKKLPEPEGGYE